ncbi:MAG: hypothetical protein ACRCS0_00170 [Albidovulum sp.]
MRFFNQLIGLAIPLVLLLPLPSRAEPRYFGYSAILCGLDDPHDEGVKTDYLDEVSAFTNIAQVCADADPGVTADRMRRAHADGVTPLLYIEPAFFDRKGRRMVAKQPEAAAALWQVVKAGIAKSKVPLDAIVFYLADEPHHFGLPQAALEEAIAVIRADFPAARILMIEAYSEDGPPPVPEGVDYWGFDAYGVPDPTAEPRYGTYLDAARATMRPDQHLVMVMEAVHYPSVHGEGVAAKESLADVARADYRYALARGDIDMILAYTWAGGIDSPDESGVRDLPAGVLAEHQAIGRAITGKR